MRFSTALVLTATLFLTGGCQVTSQQQDDALYQDLGERQGIETIVEDLLYRIADDPRIAFQFRGIDVAHFHRQLSDQICDLSGGPCTYSGMDMTESHAKMGVTNTQFNALNEQLILAMEANAVSTSAQNRLLALLAPMHGDIVNTSGD
ncbi:MAG: group 1 truncated hemoglobin [Halomonadaceae bacterium]|nr:MAG: group 1 truncated hemoglobin [Halomonadaceae bacterium]